MKGGPDMQIRPIDTLLMPPRSQEASNMSARTMIREHDTTAQLQAEHMREQQHRSEQTIKATKAENNEFRYDAKEGQGDAGTYKNPKRKKKEKTEKKDTKKEQRGSFDVRI